MLNFIKKIRNEKGAAAVEFVLVLPILVVLVFGIIYFGTIFNDYIAVSQAARDGARLLAVESFGSDGELSTYISNNLPSYLKDPNSWGHLTNINVTINHSNPDTIGDEASVKISGDFVINIPLIFSNKNIKISNEVFMRQER